MALRVAIDAHNLLTDHRGISRYLKEILLEWSTSDIEITLLVHRIFPSTARKQLESLLPGLAFRLRSRVPRDVDVVWHPWNGTFFLSNKPSVVTIHDTTPFDFLEGDAKKQASQQDPFRRSAKTAKRILTVSHHAAKGITQHLGVPLERIVITTLAPGREFLEHAQNSHLVLPVELEQQLAGRAYMLCISSMDPVKNFATLYEAWRDSSMQQDLAFVATGVDAERFPGVLALNRTANTQALIALYRHASFVAVPSLSESCPLPILEAMYLNIPVLATRVGGIPEIGADVIEYVDLATTSWSAALEAFWRNEGRRQQLRTQAQAHVQQFTWAKTAARTFEVCCDIARPLSELP